MRLPTFFFMAVFTMSAYAQAHDGDLDLSFGNGDKSRRMFRRKTRHFR
jgi:hypothetical protein